MKNKKRIYSYKLILIIVSILVTIFLLFTILFNCNFITEKVYGIIAIFTIGVATVILIIRVGISLWLFVENLHIWDNQEKTEEVIKKR